jgi:hypothetical protein
MGTSARGFCAPLWWTVNRYREHKHEYASSADDAA